MNNLQQHPERSKTSGLLRPGSRSGAHLRLRRREFRDRGVAEQHRELPGASQHHDQRHEEEQQRLRRGAHFPSVCQRQAQDPGHLGHASMRKRQGGAQLPNTQRNAMEYDRNVTPTLQV